MTYQYCNRRGDVYLLQAGTTRTGKPRYYFGLKLTGTPLNEVPAGYEVFESPERAQVHLRKRRLTKILPIEHEIVVDAIHRLAPIEHFIVDVERDGLVVYVPEMQGSQAEDLILMMTDMRAIGTKRLKDLRDRLVQQSIFTKMMRFELVDEQQRLFVVQRWCFLGSIDQWILLSPPGNLSDLVETFAQHLGAESFYEMM